MTEWPNHALVNECFKCEKPVHSPGFDCVAIGDNRYLCTECDRERKKAHKEAVAEMKRRAKEHKGKIGDLFTWKPFSKR
jgi:hypothetical protein